MMNKKVLLLYFALFIVAFSTLSCQTKSVNEWEILFGGTGLETWDTFLGPQFNPGMSWEEVRDQPSLGLNNDVPGVFSIVVLQGEPVLRISGEIWGGISTKEEYENYHLQFQFKWGELKWYPRNKDSDKRDSGLLYHGVGNHGDGDGFWLISQEFQIQEGDCGDYWGVAGAAFDIRAKKNKEDVYQYDENGSIMTFGNHTEIGRYCKKYPDGEKPNNEWNTVDLYCFGGTSVHIINGIVTMILENSRRLQNDIETPLTKGKIQFQSEAAEIFYKNIKIRPIESLPKYK